MKHPLSSICVALVAVSLTFGGCAENEDTDPFPAEGECYCAQSSLQPGCEDAKPLNFTTVWRAQAEGAPPEIYILTYKNPDDPFVTCPALAQNAGGFEQNFEAMTVGNSGFAFTDTIDGSILIWSEGRYMESDELSIKASYVARTDTLCPNTTERFTLMPGCNR